MNLTRYQLACGYVQASERNDTKVSLFMEHGVYFVSAYDFTDSKRIYRKGFSMLTEARNIYRAWVHAVITTQRKTPAILKLENVA